MGLNVALHSLGNGFVSLYRGDWRWCWLLDFSVLSNTGIFQYDLMNPAQMLQITVCIQYVHISARYLSILGEA